MESTERQSFSFYDLLTWAEVNKKLLLAAVIIIAVAGAATAIFLATQKQREHAAYSALLKLSPAAVNAAPSQEYLRIVESHGQTKAGGRAGFIVASALFQEGKFAEAKAQFEKFLADNPESQLHGLAALGVAASIEAQGKSAEAVAAYQQVISRYPDDNAALQAKLYLARIHEMEGKPDLAFRLYNELVRPTQFDAWSSEAEQRREQLMKRHPELAQAQSSAAPVPAPTAAVEPQE